ncbi:kxDL motif protein isoform X1 [Carex rostrata]
MERIGEEERASIRAASQEVSLQFRSLIDSADVDTIKHTQHQILGRLQDSNAVLSHFNEYSEQCYAEVSGEFVRKTRLLKSIKSDLDHIFMKLSCRSMKSKLKATYPDAFPDSTTSEMLDERPDLDRPL